MSASEHAVPSLSILPGQKTSGGPSYISKYLWDRFVARGMLSSLIDQLVYHLYFFVARSAVCYALENGIKRGQIRIHDGSNIYVFGPDGEQSQGPSLDVLSENFWIRIYLRYDLGCKHVIDYTFGRSTHTSSSLRGLHGWRLCYP